jgi:hypothetical protein
MIDPFIFMLFGFCLFLLFIFATGLDSGDRTPLEEI